MKNLEKQLKNKKAITLISLVVTIVILVILAAVAINMAIGNNGLFNKTKQASEDSEKAQALEELKLKIIEVQISNDGNATLQNLINFLQKDLNNEYMLATPIATIKGEIPNLENVSEIYILYKKYWFKVDRNMNVKLKNEGESVQEEIEEEIISKKIIKEGEDISLNKYFKGAGNAKVIYNGNEISSTSDLPVGEWNLKYNKVLDQIRVGDIEEIEDFGSRNNTISLKNGAKIEKDLDGNYYLSFDGIDDYAMVGELDESINWNDGFTVEVEAEWNAFNEWSRIFDFADSNKSNIIAVANYQTTGKFDLSYYNGSFYNYEVSSKTSIEKNIKKKFKIEVLKESTGYKINFIVNGELVESKNSNIEPKNLKRTNNYIAKSNVSGQGYFKGKIYSLKITQSNNDEILNINLNQFVSKYEIKTISIIGDSYTRDIVDLSGNNHKLKQLNGASVKKDSEDKYYLNFDGVDDYAMIEELDETINWNDGFTVEVEAEWNAFNEWSRIFDFADSRKSNIIAVANYSKTGKLDISYYNGSYHNYEVTNKTSIEQNIKKKYKVEVIKENTGYKINLSVNDELLESKTSNIIPGNLKRTNNYLAKSNVNGQGYFKGKIYSLKITLANENIVLWYDINRWLEIDE